MNQSEAVKKIARLQHMGIERGLELREHKVEEIVKALVTELQDEIKKLKLELAVEKPTFESISFREALRSELIVVTLNENERLKKEEVVAELRIHTLSKMLRYIAFVLTGDEKSDPQLAADGVVEKLKLVAPNRNGQNNEP